MLSRARYRRTHTRNDAAQRLASVFITTRNALSILAEMILAARGCSVPKCTLVYAHTCHANAFNNNSCPRATYSHPLEKKPRLLSLLLALLEIFHADYRPEWHPANYQPTGPIGPARFNHVPPPGIRRPSLERGTTRREKLRLDSETRAENEIISGGKSVG